MTDDHDERLEPSEERALALLALLRTESPTPSDSLNDAIVRTARWQYALRGTVALLNDLTATFVGGALFAIGAQRRNRH